MRGRGLAGLGLVVALVAAPAALAHPERQAFFPDGSQGQVPGYRAGGGQLLVVCKGDSAQRIRESFKGRGRVTTRRRRHRLRLVRRCDFEHVQDAVNAARNGARIRILPGVYREEPSRAAPEPDPRCARDYDEIGGALLESGPTGRAAPRSPTTSSSASARTRRT